MNRMRVLPLLLLLLVLSGCAAPTLPEGRECERLHPRLTVCLLTPAEMGPARERQDLVRISTPEGEQRFVGQLALRSERLDLVALTPTGLGLFRLRWDGETLNHDAPVDELPVSATRLVALLQWVLAPTEALGPVTIGGRVRERPVEGGVERLLQLDGGRTVGRARLETGPSGTVGAITIDFGEDTRVRLTPLD